MTTTTTNTHPPHINDMLAPIIAGQFETQSSHPVPDAIGRLCAAYTQSVIDDVGAEIVRIVTEQCGDARPGFWERDDDEILSDIVTEQCDAGNNQLIYTWNSRCYLMGRSNEGAYQDEIGEPAPSVEAAASAALEADVRASHWYSDAEAVLKTRRPVR